ncbi:MAG: flagellar export chaperone FlgN [Candidatus Synoicihabitans palmerolidicus]|nr:flagellar export chaperone FlgN [Candidatus Synoicihabitans palmerolidicus]
MNDSIDSLADALRDEIEHHGHLLGLLQDQQQGLLRPDPKKVLEQAQHIEQAARVANRFRIRREQLVETVAGAYNRPRSTTLLRLLVDFPEDFRPMFEALIKEVNRLVHQTRRTARQKQRLLARVVELHRDTWRSLRPDVFSPTYDQRGGLHEGTGSGAFATAV